MATARARKDKARALLSAGKDPGEAKKDQQRREQARRGNTFEVLTLEFIAKAAAEGRAASTQTKTDWLLGTANASFGKRPITEITAPMILACLRKVEARGNHETAKRLRAKIGAVFRYAVAVGLAETDPTYALQGALIRPTPKPRAARTDATKLGGLLRAIDGFQGQTVTRLALSLLVLLAPRPGELRKAKWTEFDIEAKIWSIPAERMKMRRLHQVPLPGSAIAILKDLQLLTGTGDYVFPSLRSPLRTMSENTLNVALRIMGFGGDEITSHGFRATLSTLANESGLWHPDAIERVLAHVDENAVCRACVRRRMIWNRRSDFRAESSGSSGSGYAA